MNKKNIKYQDRSKQSRNVYQFSGAYQKDILNQNGDSSRVPFGTYASFDGEKNYISIGGQALEVSSPYTDTTFCFGGWVRINRHMSSQSLLFGSNSVGSSSAVYSCGLYTNLSGQYNLRYTAGDGTTQSILRTFGQDDLKWHFWLIQCDMTGLNKKIVIYRDDIINPFYVLNGIASNFIDSTTDRSMQVNGRSGSATSLIKCDYSSFFIIQDVVSYNDRHRLKYGDILDLEQSPRIYFVFEESDGNVVYEYGTQRQDRTIAGAVPKYLWPRSSDNGKGFMYSNQFGYAEFFNQDLYFDALNIYNLKDTFTSVQTGDSNDFVAWDSPNVGDLRIVRNSGNRQYVYTDISNLGLSYGTTYSIELLSSDISGIGTSTYPIQIYISDIPGAEVDGAIIAYAQNTIIGDTYSRYMLDFLHSPSYSILQIGQLQGGGRIADFKIQDISIHQKDIDKKIPRVDSTRSFTYSPIDIVPYTGSSYSGIVSFPIKVKEHSFSILNTYTQSVSTDSIIIGKDDPISPVGYFYDFNEEYVVSFSTFSSVNYLRESNIDKIQINTDQSIDYSVQTSDVQTITVSFNTGGYLDVDTFYSMSFSVIQGGSASFQLTDLDTGNQLKDETLYCMSPTESSFITVNNIGGTVGSNLSIVEYRSMDLSNDQELFDYWFTMGGGTISAYNTIGLTISFGTVSYSIFPSYLGVNNYTSDTDHWSTYQYVRPYNYKGYNQYEVDLFELRDEFYYKGYTQSTSFIEWVNISESLRVYSSGTIYPYLYIDLSKNLGMVGNEIYEISFVSTSTIGPTGSLVFNLIEEEDINSSTPTSPIFTLTTDPSDNNTIYSATFSYDLKKPIFRIYNNAGTVNQTISSLVISSSNGSLCSKSNDQKIIHNNTFNNRDSRYLKESIFTLGGKYLHPKVEFIINPYNAPELGRYGYTGSTLVSFDTISRNPAFYVKKEGFDSGGTRNNNHPKQILLSRYPIFDIDQYLEFQIYNNSFIDGYVSGTGSSMSNWYNISDTNWTRDIRFDGWKQDSSSKQAVLSYDPILGKNTIVFDGKDDEYVRTESENTDKMIDGPHTIFCWFKTNNSFKQKQNIYGWISDNETNGEGMYIYQGRLYMVSEKNNLGVTASFPIDSDKWYFAAMSFSDKPTSGVEGEYTLLDSEFNYLLNDQTVGTTYGKYYVHTYDLRLGSTSTGSGFFDGTMVVSGIFRKYCTIDQLRYLREYFALETNFTEENGVFVSRWNTELTSAGSSPTGSVALPLHPEGTYSFTVYWGDGQSDFITSHTGRTHSYSSPGTYSIILDGTYSIFSFGNTVDRLKLVDITQWGDFDLDTTDMFYGCQNLKISAIDSPVITGSNLTNLFRDCVTISGSMSIPYFDVSDVSIMTGMFQNTSFNQNIGSWDVRNVTDLTDFMTSCSISTTNYNNLLNGWYSRGSLQTGVTLDVDQNFTSLGTASRSGLIATYSWVINDNGII